MRLECTELREFIDLVGEDRALMALSSFSVKRNPDVESFIRNNVIASFEIITANIPAHIVFHRDNAIQSCLLISKCI